MVTYAARMAKRPPQGRGSGGRVTPSPKPDVGEAPDASAKARPKARVPQATDAGKAKVARVGAKDAVRTKAAAKATGSSKTADGATSDKKNETPAKKSETSAKSAKPAAKGSAAATAATADSKRSAGRAGPEPEPEAEPEVVEDARPVGGLRGLLVGTPDPNYVKPADRVRPWWGMGDMVLWFFLAQIFGVLGLGLIVSWSGFTGPSPGLGGRVGEVVGRLSAGQAPTVTKSFADLPLQFVVLLQTPFWLGLVGGPVYSVVRKGRTLREDFGLWMTWKDIPLGLAIGVFTQVVLVSALYKVVFVVTGEQDVAEEARKLTDRASTPFQVLMLFLIVGLGAPIAEELFYRGLSQHAIAKRFGPVAGILGSALFFAAVHGQGLQFPALLMFGLILGWLVHRFGRLGPSIWAHVGFNTVTAVTLVWNLKLP